MSGPPPATRIEVRVTTRQPTYDPAVFEPHYAPLCPQCGGEGILYRWSVKEITRAEWEAREVERASWRERERARGHYIMSFRTEGWTGDWTTCWTQDKCEAVECDVCGFSAATDEPFVEARKKRAEERDAAARREFERTSGLPLGDPEHWCWYCEDNAYDSDRCDECDGAGCDACEGHGYVGYSW